MAVSRIAVLGGDGIGPEVIDQAVQLHGGAGVSQDFPEAFRWFSKAAEQGHVVAQATLGAYYWAGRGVPQDLSKAYFWGLIAAAGGDQGSSYRVAALASRLSHEQVIAEQQHANEWIKSHQLSISIPTASHK